MRRPLVLFTAVCLALLAHCSLALDRVQTKKGQLNGVIKSVSPTEVVLGRREKANETIAVNEIDFIQFDGENPKLAVARKAAIDARYEAALATLNSLAKQPTGRDEISQDIKYFQAFCAAQLALSGNGNIKDAGKLLRDFVGNNPKTYHLYEAYELLGDLFVAVDAFGQAMDNYDRVASAPWPDYKMRALVAKGRALLAQKKYPEAQQAFESAIAMDVPADDPASKSERRTATLGKATCLAERSQYNEAITLVEDVIAGAASVEDASLHAESYTTLGNCYRKAGRKKDALLAFLHVDLLYPGFPRQHAEALANLSELWAELGQRQRAQEASRVLQERYKNSPWAK